MKRFYSLLGYVVGKQKMTIDHLEYISPFTARVAKETNGHNRDQVFIPCCNTLFGPRNVHHSGHIIFKWHSVNSIFWVHPGIILWEALELDSALHSKSAGDLPQIVWRSPAPVAILSKNKRKGAEVCCILLRVSNINSSKVAGFTSVPASLRR